MYLLLSLYLLLISFFIAEFFGRLLKFILSLLIFKQILLKSVFGLELIYKRRTKYICDSGLLFVLPTIPEGDEGKDDLEKNQNEYIIIQNPREETAKIEADKLAKEQEALNKHMSVLKEYLAEKSEEGTFFDLNKFFSKGLVEKIDSALELIDNSLNHVSDNRLFYSLVILLVGYIYETISSGFNYYVTVDLKNQVCCTKPPKSLGLESQKSSFALEDEKPLIVLLEGHRIDFAFSNLDDYSYAYSIEPSDNPNNFKTISGDLKVSPEKSNLITLENIKLPKGLYILEIRNKVSPLYRRVIYLLVSDIPECENN